MTNLHMASIGMQSGICALFARRVRIQSGATFLEGGRIISRADRVKFVVGSLHLFYMEGTRN